MSSTLNLARKWRPQTFNDVVGQAVAINMLRNSLYKNHFFPVYLFAGQKGCGKTSTARILAAAANCSQLPSFQKSPEKHPVPCGTCASCTQMRAGSHPDFVEIDAASHTGVDDVRMLLESCSFMPLMGNKKIYLIDEAHMLSKAAFNAFLKVLEEPPAHTLFMLATTETLKIPDTVRSRCFQLQFAAIKSDTLLPHLRSICRSESIDVQDDALTLIIHETDGSARDALNLLEQVRFAGARITPDAVRSVLGIISAGRMGDLLALMVEHKPKELLHDLATLQTQSLNAGRTWNLFLQLVRTLIWQEYDVPLVDESLTLEAPLRSRIMKAASLKKLHEILNYLWQQEELFLSTPYKHACLEKLFLDIALDSLHAPSGGIIISSSSAPTTSTQHHLHPTPAKQTAHTPTPAHHASVQPTPPPVIHTPVKPVVAPPSPSQSSGPWALFCSSIQQLGDPILNSIFNQAQVASIDESTGTLTLALTHASPFFLEKINETAARWKPLLLPHFPGCSSIKITTSGASPAPTPRQPEKPVIPQPKAPLTPPARPQQQAPQQFGKGGFTPRPKKGPETEKLSAGAPLILNDDNKSQWPYTGLLSSLFPGKLELIASPLKR